MQRHLRLFGLLEMGGMGGFCVFVCVMLLVVTSHKCVVYTLKCILICQLRWFSASLLAWHMILRACLLVTFMCSSSSFCSFSGIQ